MNVEEARNIELLTGNMVPRCVGRYLVDLPEGFVVNGISLSRVEGVKLEVVPMAQLEFDRRLSQRQVELNNMHMDGDPKNPFLKTITESPNNTTGRLFNRAEKTGSLDVGRTLELWQFKNGYFIHAEINAVDASDPKYLNDEYWGTRGTDTSQKLARLLSVVERTSGRSDADVPTLQGVCIANGFVTGAPSDEEWIEINHHLASVRDVYTTFVSMSHIGPEDNTLLERGQEIEQSLLASNGKTLRKGEREANGLRFQEWASERESVQNPGLTIYNMYLEANSEFGNAEKPLVAFELNSGVEKPGPTRSLEEAATREPIAKATLNAAESMALWDKITATIRPRPGAF